MKRITTSLAIACLLMSAAISCSDEETPDEDEAATQYCQRLLVCDQTDSLDGCLSDTGDVSDACAACVLALTCEEIAAGGCDSDC